MTDINKGTTTQDSHRAGPIGRILRFAMAGFLTAMVTPYFLTISLQSNLKIATAYLPRGQPNPKVILGVDRDKCSEPLRSTRLCQVFLEECVVSFGCQVQDTPQVLRV